MTSNKLISAEQAAQLVRDGDIVSVSSSSGLGCPDKVLAALGARFDAEGHPRDLTTLHPIAAGDMYGIRGIDHIARPGMLKKVLAGSYPSGPSSLPMPDIWRLIGENQIAAWNLPSGVMFDMHRDAAAKRPGVLTKVGLDTFVDPDRQGGAMNARAQSEPFVKKVSFAGEEWLFYPAIAPRVAILRATTADERGNLSYEHEGALLGALDQALAARNNGGVVIAQVKRMVRAGSLKPLQVHVPGSLVDFVVVDPGSKADHADMPTTRPSAAKSSRPRRQLRADRLEPGESHRPPHCAGARRRPDRRARLRHRGERAAHPDGGAVARRGHLGDRAGGGRWCAPARFRLRLRGQCRRHRALAQPVHLFPRGRLRCRAALLPADRPAGQRQRLEARLQAVSDRGLRRLRRHHDACAQARVLRILYGRCEAAGRGRPAYASCRKASYASSWTA